MTDSDHKHEDAYDGPPDHIPDDHLLPGDLAKRRAAGRSHKPLPIAKTRVEKTEAPKKKSFFERKED